jgi:alanine racemase
VVKADGYGLGAARVAHPLAKAGARRFFVAVAEEGATLRDALGPGPGDQRLLRPHGGRRAADRGTRASRRCSTAPSNSPATASALPDAPYGIQLDSGMNRLGMEPADWAATARGGRGRADHAGHEPPRLRR